MREKGNMLWIAVAVGAVLLLIGFLAFRGGFMSDTAQTEDTTMQEETMMEESGDETMEEEPTQGDAMEDDDAMMEGETEVQINY